MSGTSLFMVHLAITLPLQLKFDSWDLNEVLDFAEAVLVAEEKDCTGAFLLSHYQL